VSLCAKPGCGHAGAVVLSYDYAARLAVLQDPPEGEVSPHLYVLCTTCAERLRPPHGWTLEDARARPPLFAQDDDEWSGIEVVDLPDRREARRVAEKPPERRQLFFGSSA
jgi:hypothetical protein